jgi:hypothetical protein
LTGTVTIAAVVPLLLGLATCVVENQIVPPTKALLEDDPDLTERFVETVLLAVRLMTVRFVEMTFDRPTLTPFR